MSLFLLAAFIVTIQFIEAYLPCVLLFGIGLLALSACVEERNGRGVCSTLLMFFGGVVTLAGILVGLVKVLGSMVSFV